MKIYIPLLLSAALILPSCGNKKQAAEAQETDTSTPSDTLLYQDICWADTVTTDSGNTVSTVVRIAYPMHGPQAELDSARAWIVNQLRGSEEMGTKLPDNVLTDGQALAEAVGKENIRYGLKDITSLEADGMGAGIQYEFNYNFSFKHQTPQYATLYSNNYVYLAGAHGSTIFSPQTIGADGTMYDWSNTIAPGKKDAIINLIKNGLMKQYFEVDTDSDFRDALLIDPDTLPLPGAPPYFSAEGINVCYQQYEIAPYAAGLPGCVIPYSEVKSLLTPQAAALLPRDEQPSAQ